MPTVTSCAGRRARNKQTAYLQSNPSVQDQPATDARVCLAALYDLHAPFYPDSPVTPLVAPSTYLCYAPYDTHRACLNQEYVPLSL